jgi:hypothetical protein
MSSGSSGGSMRRWRTMKAAPKASAAANDAAIPSAGACRANPSMPTTRPPRAGTESSALGTSKRRVSACWNGSARGASTASRMPSGTLIANSHGHGNTARIAPPIVGPAVALDATTSALIPSALPSWPLGKIVR